MHQTRITSAAEYSGALDQLCSLAMKELYIFERDFANIGFNNIERHEFIKKFLLASPHNKLQLLAHDTRSVSTNCPRLLNLLRQFGHNFQIYQTPNHFKHLAEAFVVCDDAHYIRRFHMDSTQGIMGLNDPGSTLALKSRFIEIWQASQSSPHTGSFIL